MNKKESKRKSNKDNRAEAAKQAKVSKISKQRLESPVIGVPVNVKNIQLANKPKK